MTWKPNYHDPWSISRYVHDRDEELASVVGSETYSILRPPSERGSSKLSRHGPYGHLNGTTTHNVAPPPSPPPNGHSKHDAYSRSKAKFEAKPRLPPIIEKRNSDDRYPPPPPANSLERKSRRSLSFHLERDLADRPRRLTRHSSTKEQPHHHHHHHRRHHHHQQQEYQLEEHHHDQRQHHRDRSKQHHGNGQVSNGHIPEPPFYPLVMETPLPPMPPRRLSNGCPPRPSSQLSLSELGLVSNGTTPRHSISQDSRRMCSEYSVAQHRRDREIRRSRHLFITGAALVSLLAVMAVSVYFAVRAIRANSDEKSNSKEPVETVNYEVCLKLGGMPFTADLKDKTSEKYALFELDFCEAMEEMITNSLQMPDIYETCKVVRFERGSVVVFSSVALKEELVEEVESTERADFGSKLTDFIRTELVNSTSKRLKEYRERYSPLTETLGVVAEDVRRRPTTTTSTTTTSETATTETATTRPIPTTTRPTTTKSTTTTSTTTSTTTTRPTTTPTTTTTTEPTTTSSTTTTATTTTTTEPTTILTTTTTTPIASTSITTTKRNPDAGSPEITNSPEVDSPEVTKSPGVDSPEVTNSAEVDSPEKPSTKLVSTASPKTTDASRKTTLKDGSGSTNPPDDSREVTRLPKPTKSPPVHSQETSEAPDSSGDKTDESSDKTDESSEDSSEDNDSVTRSPGRVRSTTQSTGKRTKRPQGKDKKSKEKNSSKGKSRR